MSPSTLPRGSPEHVGSREEIPGHYVRGKPRGRRLRKEVPRARLMGRSPSMLREGPRERAREDPRARAREGSPSTSTGRLPEHGAGKEPRARRERNHEHGAGRSSPSTAKGRCPEHVLTRRNPGQVCASWGPRARLLCAKIPNTRTVH
jgi:hypothetical protein